MGRRSKENQYALTYGQYQPGEHAIGDTIQFGRNDQGQIIWSSYGDRGELIYQVDNGGALPVEVRECEIRS